MSLITELRRRNVIRMAGLYLVGAWLLVQVSSTVLPAFDGPSWALRSLIVVLAILFVPALVFAWIFELTPQGLKRDADVSAEESIAPQTARRMDRLLLVVSIVAIAYFAFDKFVLAPHRDAALVEQTTEHVSAAANADRSKINPNSIAVLPFVNMSGDKDNEYFSDGISEEILNVLARISELQVAARTSSFSFRDTRKEAPEISQQLHVRMLLEGSVRKQGERVRITAQLIDADKGYHLWSQTYDRELKDIFTVQDEIANAIADELKLKIASVAEPAASSRGTRNVEAHDFYLRGLTAWQIRGEESLYSALDQFQHAVAADPAFADAYAGMSLVYAILAEWSARITADDSRGPAMDNAERALALDPTLPEPYVVLGYMADGDRRRETAQALYRRATVLRPSFATAYQWLGNSLWSSGDFDGGIAMLERASQLDPRSPVIANNHAMALVASGRYADAEAQCAPIFAATPNSLICLESSGLAALLRGDLVRARSLFQRYAGSVTGAQDEVRDLFDALEGHGDRHAMAVRLAGFTRQSANEPKSGNTFQPYMIVPMLAALGEPGMAYEYVAALAEGDRAGQSEWGILLLRPGPLHCEQRFVDLVKHMKMIDPHHATSCTKQP